jgi:hypothetical protein
MEGNHILDGEQHHRRRATTGGEIKALTEWNNNLAGKKM